MSSDYMKSAQEAKQRLDTVSDTMCLAKWMQTSLHLTTGMTNSCYHPPLHKINKDQIINSNTLKLFDNDITFENYRFEDEMYIGIRPEDISLKKDREIQLNVKIDLIENLGFEKIIYSKVSDNQIIIKSSENIDEKSIIISFSKDKVLLFDKNKNRIR